MSSGGDGTASYTSRSKINTQVCVTYGITCDTVLHGTQKYHGTRWLGCVKGGGGGGGGAGRLGAGHYGGCGARASGQQLLRRCERLCSCARYTCALVLVHECGRRLSGPRVLRIYTLPYYIESWTFFHFFLHFFSNCAENLESVCRGRMSSIAEANAAMRSSPLGSSSSARGRTTRTRGCRRRSARAPSFLGADAREDNEGDRNFEGRADAR